MKRFLLFTGDDYYPEGGWGDFGGDFDTIEEIKRTEQYIVDDWNEIVDTKTMLVVKEKVEEK